MIHVFVGGVQQWLKKSALLCSPCFRNFRDALGFTPARCALLLILRCLPASGDKLKRRLGRPRSASSHTGSPEPVPEVNVAGACTPSHAPISSGAALIAPEQRPPRRPPRQARRPLRGTPRPFALRTTFPLTMPSLLPPTRSGRLRFALGPAARASDYNASRRCGGNVYDRLCTRKSGRKRRRTTLRRRCRGQGGRSAMRSSPWQH